MSSFFFARLLSQIFHILGFGKILARNFFEKFIAANENFAASIRNVINSLQLLHIVSEAKNQKIFGSTRKKANTSKVASEASEILLRRQIEKSLASYEMKHTLYNFFL